MYRIIISFILLLMLASCTMPWDKKDTSFQGLYKAHIHHTITSLDQLSETMGINRHQKITGDMSSSINVPAIFSGTLSSGYMATVDGRNSEFLFQDPSFVFTSLVSSGSISARELGILSIAGDSYIKMSGLSLGEFLPPDVMSVVQKYENTWLSTLPSSADMTPDELQAYTFAKNLFSKSLIDIEKYLADHPVFHETADLGLSGSLHTWSVELDRDQILQMVAQAAQDLSGTGMTEEARQGIRDTLDTIAFSGQLSFDEKHPDRSVLRGQIFAAGILTDILIDQGKDAVNIVLTQVESNSTIQMSWTRSENRFSVNVSLTQSGVEMGKMTGYVDYTRKGVQAISIDVSAQGIPMSLRYNKDGESFSGNISAIVGSASWSGTTDDGVLTALYVQGTSPFATFSADLSLSGGVVQGPVKLMNGTEELFSATVGLNMTREKFSLFIDTIIQEMPTHFDFNTSTHSTSSDIKLSQPSTTLPFSDFVRDLDALQSSLNDSIEEPTQDTANQ